jgi:hypothetical protein
MGLLISLFLLRPSLYGSAMKYLSHSNLVFKTNVACAVGPSVTTSSIGFSFSKPGFLDFVWIFSGRNHLKSNISHIPNPNLTKFFPIKSCSSRSFQQHTKGTVQFLWKFQLRFNSICSEEIIQYSRTFALQVQTSSWNQAHAPILVESFPKTPRTRSEAFWFSASHNYKTKQNKLPSFIDRCLFGLSHK